MKTVAEEWDNFAEYISRNSPVGDVQRKEMKRAFYAGYWSMITDIEQAAEDGVMDSIKFMERRRAEVAEFFRGLAEKHAKRN